MLFHCKAEEDEVFDKSTLQWSIFGQRSGSDGQNQRGKLLILFTNFVVGQTKGNPDVLSRRFGVFCHVFMLACWNMGTAGRNRQRDLDISSCFDTFCCTRDVCLSVLSNNSPGIGNRLSNASPIGGSIQGPNLDIQRVSDQGKEDVSFFATETLVPFEVSTSVLEDLTPSHQPSAECFLQSTVTSNFPESPENRLCTGRLLRQEGGRRTCFCLWWQLFF